MYPSHTGRAKAMVILRCLVEVKTYGNSPIKLENTISINTETKKWASPGVLTPPIDIVNSLNR